MQVSDETCNIVYVALRTTDDNRDIMQLASRSKNGVFSVWIEPSSRNFLQGEENRGFEYENVQPFLGDQRVDSVPIKDALQAFLTVLQLPPKPAFLVGYSVNSTLRPLFEAIVRVNMVPQFLDVVVGMASFSRIVTGEPFSRMNLSGLPMSFQERNMLENGHVQHLNDSTRYVQVLEQISIKLKLKNYLDQNFISYLAALSGTFETVSIA